MRGIEAVAEFSRLINVDGVAVRILSSGPPSGRPLLLINGAGARLEMWEPFSSQLSGRRVLMFDLPGIGGSSFPPLPFRMRGLARWVIHLLDALDVDRSDLLGYSWGGALAQQIARDAPDRVRGLILASTNYGAGSALIAPMAMTRLLMRSEGPDSPSSFIAAAFGAGRRSDAQGIGALVNVLNPMATPLSRYLPQLFAFVGWTSLPWLHTLEPPTLVIAGEQDPLIPVCTTRILSNAIRGSRLALIKGAGHLFLTDQPAHAASIVGQFLDGLDTPASSPTAEA